MQFIENGCNWKISQISGFQNRLQNQSNMHLLSVRTDSKNPVCHDWPCSAKKSPRKNKTKRQAGSSSEDEELGIVEVSGEAPIISTRKTLKKNESEALLNDKDYDKPDVDLETGSANNLGASASTAPPESPVFMEKSQLILICPFDVIVFTKICFYQQIIFKDFC